MRLEKVFDTTWHTGLLYKLSKFDFSVSLIKLISSFLYKRKFFVSVENEMSTPRIMKARVPQGSVLSRTLFNMCVNDTPQAIGVHLALFADDTCLYMSERKEGYVLRKLQRGLNSVEEWSKRWNRYPFVIIATSAKEGSPHHWQFSKAHAGLRIA
jgi:hypothetical protein